MILTVRTDNPEAELGIYDHTGSQLAYSKWQAHRELSSNLLIKLTGILEEAGSQLSDIEAVVYYEGPGSFTGLRIGAAFVNALEVHAVNSHGESWIEDGIKRIPEGKSGGALPLYSSGPHVTQQKK